MTKGGTQEVAAVGHNSYATTRFSAVKHPALGGAGGGPQCPGAGHRNQADYHRSQGHRTRIGVVNRFRHLTSVAQGTGGDQTLGETPCNP